VALHVLWDCPEGVQSTDDIKKFADKYGVAPGSINPNLFQDQEYKYGSFGNPEPSIRERALRHTRDSIEIARRLHSRDISLWFADGSNYPGTANIRQRKEWFQEALQKSHAELSSDQRMLVEYKPFEPAFYHTDIADWGMAMLLARAAGPQAKVLVDTGHHYAAQNIEQIVAWLLSEDMLGGFHFNDRRYADDDLTIGSIDPYQVFRIFHEIRYFEWETSKPADIAYMVDQSHNLKGKIEAMIQTVVMAQQLFAKAALVDESCALVAAESVLQDAFATDVRPAIQEWRDSKGLPKDPMEAFRQSGYLERITKDRAARNSHSITSYA
jgi:L-rhamnose isomerase/sugar isomerase